MNKILVTISCALMIWLLIYPLGAVELQKKGAIVRIITDMYEVDWKNSESMGYNRAVVPGVRDSILEGDGNVFYHWSDYAGGGRVWGKMTDFKVLEELPNKVVVEYISEDVISFEYHCIATYQDGIPFIQHDVYVRNNFDDRAQKPGDEMYAWPVSGQDPMVIPGVTIDGMKAWQEPIAFAAYWTPKGTYCGIYSSHEKAKAALGDWRGQGEQIQLNHDWLITMVKKGEKSKTITYYVVFGKGGEWAAQRMAWKVMQVEAKSKLPTTWGVLKRKYIRKD